MFDPAKYTVGWICAIMTEFVAAQEVLDEEHDPPSFVAANDNNSYHLGRINEHNVVIAVLPDGEYGTSSAAMVARDMLSTFTNIRVGLMVGIAGGAPTQKNDIRLGDVVVSSPKNGNSGVFHYDFGKTIQEQKFQHTRHLDQPPVIVRTAATSLRAAHKRKGHKLDEIINRIIDRNEMLEDYRRPDPSTDVLYRPEAVHATGSDACNDSCGKNNQAIIKRPQRREALTIHYGLIASGDKLMKDATIRDTLAEESGVLCFEMEAAGLMNHFPCLVIRGICDYSDTHKNDDWHGYAAITAAAYAAELLRCIPQNKVEAEQKIASAVQSVQKSVQEVQNTLVSRHEDKQIISWLNSPNPSINHNTARQSRQPGTGTWLLNDSVYLKWKKEAGSFLWLHGKAGCGKTILSSTIIDDVMPQPNFLAYFYFSFSDSKKQSLDSLLRGILHQCYYRNEGSQSCLKNLWATCTKSHQDNPPTTSQLYDCLVKIATEASEELIIVIDALDESTSRQGQHGVLDFVRRLREDTIQKTHILVTSRAEPDIEMAFCRWSRIEERLSLQKSQLQEDIESYIDVELRPGGRFDRWQHRPSVLKKIKSTLVEKSEQMFRWVSCQLDSLANCLDPGTLDAELSSLPRGLDETYQRMVEKIPVESKEKAILILRFLTFSERPLNADELVDALAVDLETTPRFDPGRRMPVPAEICLFCPGLVVAEKFLDLQSQSEGFRRKRIIRLRLAHYSVKEFLTSNRIRGNLKLQMEPSVSRQFLAAVCLAYLFELDKITAQTRNGIEATHPFAEHCAKEWLEYAAGSTDKRGRVNDLAMEFFLSHGVAYRNCFRLFDPENEKSRFWRSQPRSLQPLITAGWQLSRHLSFVDEIFMPDFNEWPGYPAPGLYYASLCGIACVVEALILQGADVNEAGGRYGCPLIAAASAGHTGIVKLLIRAGAKLDAKSPKHHNALYVTSFGGHVETMQFLLIELSGEKVLDLARHDALRSACEGGRIDIVRFLLAEGAKIHHPDGSNALEAACFNGDIEIVRLLLRIGADVNGLGLNGQPPLSAAGYQGHHEVVSFLLEHRAVLPKLPQESSDLLFRPDYAYDDMIGRKFASDIAAEYYYGCYGIRTSHRSSKNHNALFAEVMPFDNGVARLVLQNFMEVDQFICSAELEVAISDGDLDYADMLLAKFVGPDLYHYGHRHIDALGAACLRGNEDLVRSLLDKGADPNSMWENHGSALGIAVSEMHVSIVNLLLQSGADVGMMSEEMGIMSEKMEIMSEEMGIMSVEMGRMSVEIGMKQQTALSLAYDQSNWTIMRILLQYGADPNGDNGAPRIFWQGGSRFHGSISEHACLENKIDAVSMFLEYGILLDKGLSPACFGGHLEIAERILETGVAPTTWSRWYGEPLGAASYNGHIQIVRLLLESWKVDVNGVLPAYGTALAAASLKGHLELVKYLLDCGADLNVLFTEAAPSTLGLDSTDGDDDYYVDLVKVIGNPSCTYGSAIAAASFGGHRDVVELLLASGATVDCPDTGQPRALECACSKGHKEIVDILIEHGADFEAPVLCYPSLLIAAAVGGRAEIVQLLLDLKIDQNEQFESDGNLGYTQYGNALHAASCRGNEEVTRLLLPKATGLSLPVGEHENLLFAVLSEWNKAGYSTPMEKIGRLEKIVRLERILEMLVLNGADSLCNQKQYNLLLLGSSEADFANFVEHLISKGADVNACNSAGQSAYDLAFLGQNAKTVWVLLDHGCEISLWEHGVDYRQNGLLHFAARDGRTDVVRRCISAGLDVNSTDGGFGLTPLEFAVENNRHENVGILLEAGADVLQCRKHSMVLQYAKTHGLIACIKEMEEWLDDEAVSAVTPAK